ncbi:MAG: hypothetical protein AAF456_18415, partial [Planctomycetota bacterium]
SIENGDLFQLGTNDGGGRDLPANEVAMALKLKDVRLAVMVSEFCDRSLPRNSAVGRGAVAGTFDTLTNLEDLLLNYRGFINVKSVDDGQLGWGEQIYGGFYTLAFTRLLSGFEPGAGWESELRQISEVVSEQYRKKRDELMEAGQATPEMIGQESMSPVILEMQIQRDAYEVEPGTRPVPPGSP